MEPDPRFWSCRPRRCLAWEEDERGRAVLLRPKFGSGRLGRWLSRRARDPHYRIKLDEVGSLVWKACDGETEVSQILQEMKRHFGDSVEPAEQRLFQFFSRMHRSRLVEF